MAKDEIQYIFFYQKEHKYSITKELRLRSTKQIYFFPFLYSFFPSLLSFFFSSFLIFSPFFFYLFFFSFSLPPQWFPAIFSSFPTTFPPYGSSLLHFFHLCFITLPTFSTISSFPIFLPSFPPSQHFTPPILLSNI